MDRRHAVSAIAAGILLASVLGGCTAESGAASPPSDTPSPSASASVEHSGVERALADLEREFDATVGVFAMDTATGAYIAFGEDRRFGFASTIKAFAAAQFLRSVEGEARGEFVHWTADDVAAAGHSPVTSQHIDSGLTYAQLAEAALRQSDNTALNLILKRIGGPSALDDALAELGDTTTEVVNYEPTLNTIEPGSTEDTTTAAAFARSLATVLDGTTLSAADTELLLDWMSDNRTGDALIRAGAPAGWKVFDKSGGAGHIRNDIALVDRPGAPPLVVSVLTMRNDPDTAYDDALVAKAASVVLSAFGTGR